jgi:hypothetical protein
MGRADLSRMGARCSNGQFLHSGKPAIFDHHAELSTGRLFFFISFFYFRAKKLLSANGLSMVTGTNRGTTGTNRG